MRGEVPDACNVEGSRDVEPRAVIMIATPDGLADVRHGTESDATDPADATGFSCNPHLILDSVRDAEDMRAAVVEGRCSLTAFSTDLQPPHAEVEQVCGRAERHPPRGTREGRNRRSASRRSQSAGARRAAGTGRPAPEGFAGITQLSARDGALNVTPKGSGSMSTTTRTTEPGSLTTP